MDIYFVRHGQTACNARHMHQAPSTPLNEKGREQALSVAEEIRALNPDSLITSDYQRTKETARLIGQTLGLTIEENSLFREVRRPARLYGKSHFNPLTLWYVLQSVWHRGDSSWRCDDAENFSDIRARTQRALLFIESLKDDHQSVVVVSHTIFINLLAAYMCRNRVLELRDLLPALLHVTKMKNGGIMHLKYEEKTDGNVCKWLLIK